MTLPNLDDLALLRLKRQGIANPAFQQPAEVVTWLGAMQAQDFLGAKWSVGLRLPGSCEADIDRALAEGQIIRTWLMRGTLHLVAAADVRWILRLIGPLTLARQAAHNRRLGLDADTLARSFEAMARAMQGGKQLTRQELAAVLAQAGLPVQNDQANHQMYAAALDGLICLGAPRGKQATYGLLEEWVAPAAAKSREESLAELARRYFSARGPATLKDFAWWAALPAADARAGLEAVSAELVQEEVAGQVYWRAPGAPAARTGAAYLLPAFDELLLGYADRGAALDPEHLAQWMGVKNGLFPPTIVVDGRVVGFWRRTLEKKTARIEVNPFAPFADGLLDSAAQRYGEYLGLPVVL